MIEEDEEALADSQNQDALMQPSPKQDVKAQTITDEKAILESMAAQMDAFKLGEEAKAGIKARLAELAVVTSPQANLASSITLRQALKRTRDLYDNTARAASQ